MHIQIKLFALTLFAVGAVLAIGGLQLALLDGSLYYLFGGITLLASARWVWYGNILGYWGYCVFAAVTLLWSIAESGAALWALLPRLAVPSALLMAFFIPSISRHLSIGDRSFRVAPAILGAVVVVLLKLSSKRTHSTLHVTNTAFITNLIGHSTLLKATLRSYEIN